MAYEAVCYEAPTKFARYTVADGTGITKGTILALHTPNTASTAVGTCRPAGIAWSEKTASDGTTELNCALNGVWGLAVSTVTGVTCGYDVVTGATVSNSVRNYTTLDREKGRVLGKALETVAVSTAASCTYAKVRLSMMR